MSNLFCFNALVCSIDKTTFHKDTNFFPNNDEYCNFSSKNVLFVCRLNKNYSLNHES